MNKDKLVIVEPKSLFGDGLDTLARSRGGWPDNVLPYAVEVIGEGCNPQILIIGGVPVGVKRDGSPKFGSGQRQYKVAIQLSEYRTALARGEHP